MRKKKPEDIEDYFSTETTRFMYLLKTTGKWKEIYNQKECQVAAIFSVVITGCLVFVYYESEFSQYIELLKNMLQIAIETTVGMLGFIISGLAIFTGTITTRLAENINSDKKINSLISILFSFYFIGMIMGCSFVLYLIVYTFFTTNYGFHVWILVSTSVICSYLYLFCIFYSISLLGTCLRLFLISYKYSKDDDSST